MDEWAAEHLKDDEAGERAYLARVAEVVRAQLEAAERDEEARGADAAAAALELREMGRERFGKLWGSDAFEEMVNLSQVAEAHLVDRAAREVARARLFALRGMREQPYFARIDLTYDDGGDSERIYLGRATLRDEATREILVTDWRAPVASVFYRFGVGAFSYDAPGGRITGRMTRKRQYEIQGGALQYFFDADVAVEDEFLRAMLRRNASPRMKAIVETIQRDQDAVIRDQAHELVMVQGVAGSGKTSIALHRAAYLMYRGHAAPLKADELLILSPSPQFERYIFGVLPELGEQCTRTVTMEAIYEELLPGQPVESRAQRFERLCAGARRPGLAFKGSAAFVLLLDRFVRELPRRWMAFEDVMYAGRIVATREQLKMRLMMRADAAPLGVRLRRMERAIWHEIHARRPARREALIDVARRFPRHVLELTETARAYSILESTILARRLARMTRLNAKALYRRLMADREALKRLAGGAALPDDLMRAPMNAGRGAPVPYEDAAAVAYLSLAIAGAPGGSRVRHVVVDEAQDVSAVDFAVLAMLFPDARFTVLGDVDQALERPVGLTHYDDIASQLHRRSALFASLSKSFRCTREILRFSRSFLADAGPVEGFNRGGEEPGVHAARDQDAMALEMAREIAHCRALKYGSVAVIALTQADARRWHGALSRHVTLALQDADSAAEPVGVFVTTLARTKGLEFDAVLIPDAQRYDGVGEGRWLYVACTRALHRLNLYRLEGRS